MSLLCSVQAPWARPGVSAIRHHAAQMAVRSCAVGGAMTPRESSKSLSASASSNGAAPWSVRTARKLWTYTRAKRPSVQNGWTRPEDAPPPPPPPVMQPHPFPRYGTSCGTWHSGKVCPKVLCVSALPLPPPWFIIAWLLYPSL